MISTSRTNSNDPAFQELVKALDLELQIRDGEEHAFYAQLNKTDHIKHVVLAWENNEAVGCGALRAYTDDTMEVKRMFVPLQHRRKGIASVVLSELENWCRELGYNRCILETGKNQPEAIAMYQRNQYTIIPNFGKYTGVENSVCFEKDFSKES
ncbi:MAG: GNAT family N-acetyltransferase [Chitinophagales bacterium]|nr:GNAT family N-acetyltransferase [Chitinophagales bacterium]